MARPVILALIDEHTDVRANLSVKAFCLTVRLRMIGCGKVRFNTEILERGSHDSRFELRSSVTHETFGYTMQSEDIFVVNISEVFCSTSIPAADDVTSFSCEIYESGDGIDVIDEFQSGDDCGAV